MSNGDSTDQTSTDQTGAETVAAPARQRAPRRRAATRPSGPPGGEAPAASAAAESPATDVPAPESPVAEGSATESSAPPAASPETATSEVAPARRAPRRRAASRPAGAPGPDAAAPAPAPDEAVVTASEPLVADEPAVVVEDVDVAVVVETDEPDVAVEPDEAPVADGPAAAVEPEAPVAPAERAPRRSGSRRAASRPAGPPQPVAEEAPTSPAAPPSAPAATVTPSRTPTPASSTDDASSEAAAAAPEPSAEEAPATGRGRGGRRSRAAGAPAGAPAVRPAAEAVPTRAAEAPEPPAAPVETPPATTPRTPDAPAASDDAPADDSRTRRPARGRGRTGGRPAEAPSGRVELGSGALAGPSRPAVRSPQFDDGDADLLDADPGDLPESAAEETPRGRRGGRGRSRRAGSPATEPQTSQDRASQDQAPVDRTTEADEDAASASSGSGDPRVDGLGVDLAAELGQLRRRRPAAGSAEGTGRSVDDLVRFDADDSDDADDTGSDRGDDDDQGEDDEDGARARRSRRRRGGRGRRRRTPGDDAEGSEGPDGADGSHEAEGDEDDDEDEPTAGGRRDAAATEDGSSDDGGPGEDDEDDEDDPTGTGADDGGEGGSRRRRRRRRRSGSDATGESEEGEGAEEDASGEAGEDDGSRRRGRGAARTPAVRGTGVEDVTAIKGSTRLEAKRQRRRDGRESGRRPKIISEAEFLARREAVERTMVVRSRAGRTQIAVLEDDVLVEHYVARKQHGSMIGNVYLGKVQNVLPSMEAAFVDIGRGRNAVLYAGEVNWEAAGLSGQAKRIESALKSGDPVLVQVSKDPVGHKGARLTSQVSLPGRYLVYVPGGSMTGISRKLPDTERARLKKILREVVPEDGGVIVRTAAEGASEVELRRDVERLVAQWEEISARAKKVSPPVLLHGEPDLTIKVVRDVFNEDFSSLVVDGDDAWDAIAPYIEQVAPDLADRVERWDDPRDAFAAHRIDEQIAKALERKVWLPSGGSLVIDRTEAMTVVDVNTGRFTGSGGNLEETVTKNNLEAAEEIVRQLRLRDIGGIVVVDFIDMVLESNRDLVLRRLVECLGRDRTKHQVAEVTSLGLVQMTRKRVGQGLLEAFSENCEHCHGRGVVLRDEPVEIVEEVEPEGGRGRRGGRSSADAEPLLARDPSVVPAASSPVPEPRDAAERARQDAARDAVAHAIHGVALASKLVAPHHDDHAHDDHAQGAHGHDDGAPDGAGHEPAALEAATVAVAQVAAEAAAEVAADPSGDAPADAGDTTPDTSPDAPVEAPSDVPLDAPETPAAPQDGEAV